MSPVRVPRPAEPDRIESLSEELRGWLRVEFEKGRLSTRMMTEKLRQEGHDIKRQDVWAWLLVEAENGTKKDSEPEEVS